MAVNSQSDQALAGRIDQSSLKGIVKNRITELVTKKPIQGIDSFENEGIVYSKPLEMFYRESRTSVGGLLLVPGGTGMGKSSTLQAVARSYIENCPPRFLIVEPHELFRGEGAEWYGSIAKKLGVPLSVEPGVLAEKLYEVLRDTKIKTPDSFRLKVEGRPFIDSSHDAYKKEPLGLLILDGINPMDFTFQYKEGVDQNAEILEARIKLGKTYAFLDALSATVYKKKVVVFLTTKNEDFARFLHIQINGGTKCLLAKSLMKTQGINYNPATFDIKKEDIPLRWNDGTLYEFLSEKYSHEEKAFIRKVADETEPKCPRVCCMILEEEYSLVPVGVSRVEEELETVWVCDAPSFCSIL